MSNFVMHWFDERDPRMMPGYDWRFQSNEYDEAMRHYGDVYHSHQSASHPDVSAAYDRVVGIRERMAGEWLHERQVKRVLRYSC